MSSMISSILPSLSPLRLTTASPVTVLAESTFGVMVMIHLLSGHRAPGREASKGRACAPRYGHCTSCAVRDARARARERSMHMNWEQLEGKWKQMKGRAKQQWGELTDDDLDRIEGTRDELV